MTKKHLISLLAAALLTLLTGTAFAAKPVYSVPQKVEHTMKACQDLAAIARKYNIDNVFPREFAEGKIGLTRVELAAALHLTNEKLAEKVVQDGGDAVAKSDLDILADIREELRAEMLLVGTRTFQQRNELLGTQLHPLTRTISMSGQLVGVFQSTAGYDTGGHAAFNGRGDLVFNFKLGDKTTAVINVDALTGDGIDPAIASFSSLNATADSTGGMARFRQAWVEHTMFDERLVGTIGKIDVANYFDNNAVANDENSQFLAGAFVNSHTLSLPDRGPGARLSAYICSFFQFSLAYASGDASGNDFLRNGFGIAQADLKLKFGEREGNYRLYGAIDGALPDGTVKRTQTNAFNAGISLDQQLTGSLSIFGRYGERDKNVYLTNRSWSAGLQYAGLIPGRDDDTFGLAYGQISGKWLSTREKLIEGYYSIKMNNKVSISPVAQYLIDPAGVKTTDKVLALGLRSLVSF